MASLRIRMAYFLDWQKDLYIGSTNLTPPSEDDLWICHHNLLKVKWSDFVELATQTHLIPNALLITEVASSWVRKCTYSCAKEGFWIVSLTNWCMYVIMRTSSMDWPSMQDLLLELQCSVLKDADVPHLHQATALNQPFLDSAVSRGVCDSTSFYLGINPIVFISFCGDADSRVA